MNILHCNVNWCVCVCVYFTLQCQLVCVCVCVCVTHTHAHRVFNLKVDRILMSSLFTKIYSMLYYTTNLYLQ